MIPADEALHRLLEGNRRFAAGTPRSDGIADPDRRKRLVAGQKPFAVILGCSDSRVPPEVVFDQGLGDLFVVRVAGNITAPSLVESIELATAVFGARLVMVLGHGGCGAIQVTVEALRGPAGGDGSAFPSIVSRIRPAIESLVERDRGLSDDALIERAVRANVRSVAGHLTSRSETLATLTETAGLRVVGAEYAQDSGLVEMLPSGE